MGERVDEFKDAVAETAERAADTAKDAASAADRTASRVAGEAKEAAGKATGDDSLEREGKVDQAKAHVRQAAHDVKEALS
jgi:uncharacterized protein YjbJ (UPF0337 family)